MNRILLEIVGSLYPEYGRQLSGIGGGVSSLSKVVVVDPPFPSESLPEGKIDAEYTFA